MDEEMCNDTVPILNGSMMANETVCSNVSNETMRQCPPGSLPPSIPVFVNYFQAVIVFAILVSSISLNGFVIFMVWRYKKLHKRAFFLGLNLIVAHFIFSVTVLPFMFVTAISTEWLFGDAMCQILGAIHDTLITFRYLFTLVLTIDRMCTIFFPFFYTKYGGKISAAMAIVMWSIAFSRSISALDFIAGCYGYLPTFKMCTAVGCSTVCLGHTLGYAGLLAVTGVILPFILYLILYCRVKKLQREMTSATRAGVRIMHSVVVATVSNTEIERCRSDSIIERSDRSEHNKRVMITFMTLVLVLVGFALPPYILYTVQFAITSTGNATPTTAAILAVFQIFVGRTFIYGLTFTDPIVIMRNQDVRDTLRKIRTTVREQRRQSITTLRSYSRRASQITSSTFLSSGADDTANNGPSSCSKDDKVVSFKELNVSVSSDSGEREDRKT